MDCYGLTDMGKVRQNNEDQFLIADLNKSMQVHQTSLGLEDQTRIFGGSQGVLMLVADGMGGRASGEIASQIAVDSLVSYLLNTMPWCLRLDQDGQDDHLEMLKTALERCQRDIQANVEGQPEHRGMGTTLTAAYAVWPRLYVVHAGDSRCYLYRREQLRQITADHTLAQRMVEQGVLRAEEAATSRFSHVLWKALGGSQHRVNPEVHKLGLQRNLWVKSVL